MRTEESHAVLREGSVWPAQPREEGSGSPDVGGLEQSSKAGLWDASLLLAAPVTMCGAFQGEGPGPEEGHRRDPVGQQSAHVKF